MCRSIEVEMAVSPDERAFFRKLGDRIAVLRKERGLTQVQLAETLDVSQQQVQSFEKGRRRVPASTLPALGKALGVSVEELLGVDAKPAKRGPTPKLQRQLEQLQQLPRSKQRFVSEMLDTIIQQAS
jgi:transcriptional regulator with XRE-family HTH domain